MWLTGAGTNEWIAQDARFTTWRDDDGSAVLLIKAGAGHGKLVLLKHLLQTEMTTDIRRLTSFFFFHGESDLGRSTLECMNAMIYQIFEQQPNLVPRVREAFPVTNINAKHHFDALRKIVEFCINEYGRQVILIVDGLDEYSEPEPKAASLGSGRWAHFFDWLPSIVSNKQSQVKFLCSIRTGADTAFYTSDQFDVLPKTVIDLNDEHDHSQVDLEKYIGSKVARPNITVEKREELTAMLLDLQQSSGSYLWLKLVFEILPRPAFETMSISDFKHYLLKDDMDRIDRQFSELLPTGDMRRAVAKVVFSILLGARRPLPIGELIGAVRTVTGKFYLLTRPDVLADYCGAFVEIRTIRSTTLSWKKIVTFFHDHARTYLLNLPELGTGIGSSTISVRGGQPENFNAAEITTGTRARLASTGFLHSFDAQDIDLYMLDVCVKYIKEQASHQDLDENTKYKSMYATVKGWISSYLDDHPFMEYAAIHWINHLPLDETNSWEQQKIAKQVGDLLDVSSNTFRTWFAFNWRIWSQDMPMADFFRVYITAFVADHLAPNAKVMKEFHVSDGGIKDTWLWWTINGGLSEFRELMSKCNPGYDNAPQTAAATPLWLTPSPFSGSRHGN